MMRRNVGQNVPLFADQTSIGGLDENYKVHFVTSHSDLSGDDVVNILKQDPQNLNDLMLWGLQLPMKPKLLAQLLVVAVANKLFDSRHSQCGKRLANFKANGGVCVDYSLQFKAKTGSHDLTFDDAGILVCVIHCTGDSVNISAEYKLSNKHALRDNNDDWEAHLVMAPMSLVKLHGFFDAKQKTGPFKIMKYGGKARAFQQLAEETHTAWQTEYMARSGGNILPKEVQDSLEKHRAEKRKGAMTVARAAAEKSVGEEKGAQDSGSDVSI